MKVKQTVKGLAISMHTDINLPVSARTGVSAAESIRRQNMGFQINSR